MMKSRDERATPTTAGIGDIRGCSKALQALIGEIQQRFEDLRVMLEDIVDRGPDRRGVIGLWIGLADRRRRIRLLGNQEAISLNAGIDVGVELLDEPQHPGNSNVTLQPENWFGRASTAK